MAEDSVVLLAEDPDDDEEPPQPAKPEGKPEEGSRPRRWEWRLVKQKTLTGEITVRKWVSDEMPSLVAKHTNGEAQTVRAPAMLRV